MSSSRSVVYFAYGSNLLFARLHARTPSIVNLGIGNLPGHRMNFNKPGGDGSGKCGIEEADNGDQVFGVLYRMAAVEKPDLDRIEGVGHGYMDHPVEVLTAAGPVSAFTYYPTRLDHERPPFDWYKCLVLSGARQNRLPLHYIRFIESVECEVDADEARRLTNLQICEQGQQGEGFGLPQGVVTAIV